MKKAKLKKENNVGTTTSVNKLKYTGKVKVSLAIGKHIISTKEYHNEGGSKLFEFFSYCLRGDYSASEALRPCRIQLYYNTAESPQPEDLAKGKLIPRTNRILYAQTPQTSLNVTASGSQEWWTNLHFTIPFTQLILNDLSTPKIEINQARLFNDSVTTSNDAFSANYLFDIPSDTGNIWAPLEIDPAGDANVTIIVDWSLKIGNGNDA